MSSNVCVVFICNESYYGRFQHSCNELLTNGKYNGDIALVVFDDLKSIEQTPFIINNNIIVKRFSPFIFDSNFLLNQKLLERPSHWYAKLFQYNKFYLFDQYFKKWNYILYIDCGMRIMSDIAPILNERTAGTLLANRDGVDNETACWCIPETPMKGLKIGDQFVKTAPHYHTLMERFDMKQNYFQTTCMLYDTTIIEDNTVAELYKMLLTYPISITNDQAIIALYFTQVKPAWMQLRRKNENTYFYDYVRCVNKPYIMIKSPDNRYLHIGYNDN
jgi:hypothetical protein